MQELLLDTHIWFIFSFVIFAGIILKFGLPALNGMLDGRITQIKKDLETAENLRIEAQEMLAQYQRKHRDAVQESEKIVATAKENAKQFQKQAEDDLKVLIERREAQLEDRLVRMEQNAINEIQAYAADLAINAARQIIEEKLDKKANAKLVEQSIESIDANIH